MFMVNVFELIINIFESFQNNKFSAKQVTNQSVFQLHHI